MKNILSKHRHIKSINDWDVIEKEGFDEVTKEKIIRKPKKVKDEANRI